MKKILLIIALFFTPFVANAAADLSIEQDDIRFSEETFVVGDTVRIYASINNIGDEDVSGYVTFYQGAVAIGQSQVISVLAGGNPEEVYLDFVVPPGNFNIQAKIQGTDPEDMNTTNDFTITNTQTPIEDADRDGIEDALDNCPETSNANQQNSDNDSSGDECDTDDDNDGLSDDVEIEIGSSTTVSDTDADGVEDADDAYPTDPLRSEIEVVLDPVVSGEAGPGSAGEPEVEDTDAFRQIIAELAEEIEATQEDVAVSLSDTQELEDLEVVDGEGSEESSHSDVTEAPIELSPNAVFSFQRDSWNTYTFMLLSPEEPAAVYRWDFGDGVNSSKTSVSHTYGSSGAFQVTLSIQDDTGVYDQESATVFVPFFALGNRIVLVAVLFLGLLLVIGCGMLVLTYRKTHQKK